MRIGVIGSGAVGRRLSAGWAGAGHEVVLGSRDPQAADLREWAAGEAGVEVGSPAEAASSADVVVNATPGTSSLSALQAAGADQLDGSVLLDVSNPLDFSSGQARLAVGPDDSVGEQLQRAFPRLRVVKSLCTVNNPIMVDPGLLAEPTTMFLAGDDAAAKRTVEELLESTGWAPEQLLDLGGIDSARQLEANILLWLKIAGALDTVAFNVRVVPAAKP